MANECAHEYKSQYLRHRASLCPEMIFLRICPEIPLKVLAVISHAAKGFMKVHTVMRHIDDTPGNVGTVVGSTLQAGEQV